jgi:hypothetical protein
MGYKQYTICINPDNFIDLSHLGGRGLLALVFVLLASLVIFFWNPGIFVGLLIVAIAAVSAFIVYLNWDAYGRLICLGKDPRNCAIIGVVWSIEPADPAGKGGDNDYCINILLAPGPINSGELIEAYRKPPQGHLVDKNLKIVDMPRAYVQEGDTYMRALHCEFEGDGMRRILDAMYGVLALLLGSFFIPGLWLAALAILILTLIRRIFSADPTAPGTGTPLDIDPSLGSLSKGDVVVVRGEWVYDSLHEGWNEIHPVRGCQIIGSLRKDQDWKDFKYKDKDTGAEFSLDSVETVEKFRDFWCGLLKDADDAEDGGSRNNPANDWGIHPSIDGCKPPIIIE